MNTSKNNRISVKPLCNGYYVVKCSIRNKVIGIYCDKKNPANPNADNMVVNNKTLYRFSNLITFLKLAN